VGIDGVAVKNFSISGHTIRLGLTNQIAELPYPYTDHFKMELRVVGLEAGDYDLVVNQQPPRRLSGRELERTSIEIGGAV
jgi:hypothetical protein